MPSQRPFFLSTFFAAFRQQSPGPLGTQQAANKQTTTAASSYGPSAQRSISTTAAAAAAAVAASSSSSAASAQPPQSPPQRQGLASLHAPRAAIPIPQGRRRGSDSSSEGFREVLGADKWYIGGRTAAGEEKFFKLGVVRRVRSGDRLSLDRLSL